MLLNTEMAKLVPMEEILGENLYSKVCEITTIGNVEKITGMLLECEKNKILQMLSDKEVLQHYVKTATETLNDMETNNDVKQRGNNLMEAKAVYINVYHEDDTDDVLSVSSSKESCADELYDQVYSFLNCEMLTSKITGMLLDVDFDKLMEIMKSEEKLKEAIEKAKRALCEKDLLICAHDQLSDEIYARVKLKYPDLAPQITGMLVEMSTESLASLLKNEEELDSKIQKAMIALSHNCDA